jgi:hypothetical protein
MPVNNQQFDYFGHFCVNVNSGSSMFSEGGTAKRCCRRFARLTPGEDF